MTRSQSTSGSETSGPLRSVPPASGPSGPSALRCTRSTAPTRSARRTPSAIDALRSRCFMREPPSAPRTARTAGEVGLEQELREQQQTPGLPEGDLLPAEDV